MPILVEQFEPQFDRLCAAFALTKTEKVKTEWFKEFEDCDYYTFCKAIKLLRLGDRFPNLGMIWDTYNPMLPFELRKKERRGCDHCENGKVFYVDFVLSNLDDPNSGVLSYSLIANCSECSKGVLSGLIDISRVKLVMQDNREYWTKRAVQALPAEVERLENDNQLRRQNWKKTQFSIRHSMAGK